MKFEWDSLKAAANLRKHGISFNEAATVFDDPLAITYPDPDHPEFEKRQVTFGESATHRLLVISQVERSGSIRIISARKATRKERKIYEEG